MSDQKQAIKKILTESEGTSKDGLAKMIVDYLKKQQGTTEESGDAKAQAIINLTWSGGVTMDQAARIMVNPASASTIKWSIQKDGIWSEDAGDNGSVASWEDEYGYLITGAGIDVLFLAAGLTQM